MCNSYKKKFLKIIYYVKWFIERRVRQGRDYSNLNRKRPLISVLCKRYIQSLSMILKYPEFLTRVLVGVRDLPVRAWWVFVQFKKVFDQFLWLLITNSTVWEMVKTVPVQINHSMCECWLSVVDAGFCGGEVDMIAFLDLNGENMKNR